MIDEQMSKKPRHYQFLLLTRTDRTIKCLIPLAQDAGNGCIRMVQ